MKIISSGKAIHSPAFYKKKRRRRQIILISIFVTLSLLLGLIVYLLRIDKFQIQEVRVIGEDVGDTSEVVEEVQTIISGNYIWVVPRANALFYPQEEIISSIQEKYPEFKSVSPNTDWLNVLNINIEKRKPYVLYCRSLNKCYFADETGFVFEEAPDFSDKPYLSYTLASPLESPLGKYFTDVSTLLALSQFIEDLADFSIEPINLDIEEDYYSLTFGNGAELMWSKRDDMRFVLTNLEAFLSSEAIRSQKDFLERVLYLDLRTENKVFYKFK